MKKKIQLKQNIVIVYVLIFLVVVVLASFLILKSFAFSSKDNENDTIKNNTNKIENVNNNVTNNSVSNNTNTNTNTNTNMNTNTNTSSNNTTNVIDNKPDINNTTSESPSQNVTVNTSYIQDEFTIDDITLDDTKIIFNEKHAMAVGDSMAEGLDCYGVLNKENVVWHRGRRIDNMYLDLESVKAYNPDYLFLAYGANDIKSFRGNVDGWIAKYKEAIINIQSELPNTKIIVNSVLPVSDYAATNDPSFTYQPMYNDALKNLAKELGIQFLENGVYLADRVNSFSADGVHPKVPFFQSWGRHMASYLKSVN